MSSDSSANIKNAASLLIKGGTLTGEPCEQCGGVMIRFGERTTCINCGAEKSKVAHSQDDGIESPKQISRAVTDLRSVTEIIEQKIIILASNIAAENDIMLQKQKADLLESYLRILDKVRSL